MSEKKVQAEGGEGGTATAVKERVCSECKGKMVQRKSKFGTFYGCANYPKCKHIDKG